MPQTELFLKEPSEGQPRGGQRASAIIPIQGGFAIKKCLLVWGSKTRECSHSSPAFLRAIHALVSHTLTAWPASIFRNEGEAQVKVRVFINSLLDGYLDSSLLGLSEVNLCFPS